MDDGDEIEENSDAVSDDIGDESSEGEREMSDFEDVGEEGLILASRLCFQWS